MDKMTATLTDVLKTAADNITTAVVNSKDGNGLTLLGNLDKVSSFVQNDAGQSLQKVAVKFDIKNPNAIDAALKAQRDIFTGDAAVKAINNIVVDTQKSVGDIIAADAAAKKALEDARIAAEQAAIEKAAAEQKAINDARIAAEQAAIEKAAAEQKAINDARIAAEQAAIEKAAAEQKAIEDARIAAARAIEDARDRTPPSITINDISSSDTQVNGLTKYKILSITGTVSDNVALSSVQIYDGENLLSGSARVTNSQWTYLTPELLDGPHGFQAKAVDSSNNSGFSGLLNVTIDSIAPLSSTNNTDTVGIKITFYDSIGSITKVLIDTGLFAGTTENDGLIPYTIASGLNAVTTYYLHSDKSLEKYSVINVNTFTDSQNIIHEKKNTTFFDSNGMMQNTEFTDTFTISNVTHVHQSLISAPTIVDGNERRIGEDKEFNGSTWTTTATWTSTIEKNYDSSNLLISRTEIRDYSNSLNYVTKQINVFDNNRSLISSDQTIMGSSENDFLVGESGSDLINGGSGDDFISGGQGSDTIDGGAGYDMISYRNFDYQNSSGIFGVNVNLSTTIGSATDNWGNTDTLSSIEAVEGSDLNDTLIGGDGSDHIQGGDGADLIFGGMGSSDTISAGLEGDFLSGDAGNDTLYGSAGSDNIQGGDGDDSIKGGNGDDFISGGSGIDTLTGGTGNDIFALNLGSQSISSSNVTDVITDFASGSDKIDFGIPGSGIQFVSQTNLAALLTAVNGINDIAGKLFYFGVVAPDSYLVTKDAGMINNIIKLSGVTSLDSTDIVGF